MNTERRASKKMSLCCTSAALLFVQFAFALPSSAESVPRVDPPHAMVAGRTIGEWTGDWWRSAISAVDFPFPANVSQPGALGNFRGPVFFAVASPGPGVTTYTYTVPRGKHVLLPLYTYSWAIQTSSDPCSDVHCAHALVDSWVHATTSMKVGIDGEPIRNLFSHYEATPDFSAVSVPVAGWWAGGDPALAGLWHVFASGYWLMLEPLSPGRHVVSITVTAPYSCADCGAIPSPGPPEVSATMLILTVPCDEDERDDRCKAER